MAEFYTLSVKHIEPLTPSAVEVSFTIPQNLASTFNFLPGQYITVKTTINGEEVRRAYSICSSPKQDFISIGVKKVDAGGFSDFAHTQLKAGNTLEVMPPEGRFTFTSSENAQQIAAFAAGSGITPIMSIAKAVLDDHPKNTFVLVYGNKSAKETMFYEEIKDLATNYADRFFVHFITSQTQEDDSRFGRVDTAMVNYVIKNKHKDLNFDAYYLCGPEAMIDLVSDTLQNNNISKDKIHFELFTTTEMTDEPTIPGRRSNPNYCNGR